jgi:hypothetical protein
MVESSNSIRAVTESFALIVCVIAERLFQAGLGSLEGVLVVLVVTGHRQFGRRGVHARNGEHRNHDKQDQADDECGALLFLVGVQHLHGRSL